MTHQSNILDPVHETLDPTVFDDVDSEEPKLKPSHNKWIIHLVKSTLSGHGYTDIDSWLSLVLTGSLTTYQYSEDSDVDVSLFVNTEHFPEWSRAEMIGIMVNDIDGKKLPGTTHPMQCFVVPASIKREDLYKPGLRSGYDLESNRWILPPEKDRVHDVEREQNIDYMYALECADKMERLLRYEPDKAIQYWHQIHERRRKDQLAGKGDFAQSNIVYKFLANRGLFKQISEASGEYIAKVAATNLIYKKFKPTIEHPKGAGEADLPFIYAPEHDTVFLGPPGSYHWDLINSSRALKDQYDENEKWKGAPFVVHRKHLHGRMEWPSKQLHFLGLTPEKRAFIPKVAEALEAPIPEDINPQPDGVWSFG